MNVCDLILEILADAGVRYIFAIPGGAINEMVEAIRKQDTVKMIHVRHEEAGAFAASGIAKLTGELAVCMGTSGPGAIHLLNGLYDAREDMAPVLAISGQVKTEVEGTDTHQEVDLKTLFQGVSVYNQDIVSTEQMPRIMEEALRSALTYKGVAHISLPSDIAGKEIKHTYERSHFFRSTSIPVPAEREIQKAANLLNQNTKVCILAGAGAKDASAELIRISELLQAPVVKALRGKDVMDDMHPNCMGGLGLLGTKPGYNAVMGCDILLMVGTDFPYYDFYPKNAKAIQIDLNAANIGRRTAVDVGLEGDSKDTLTRLINIISQKQDSDYLQGLQKDMQSWWKHIENSEINKKDIIHPQSVAALISKHASNDAIFCVDTGNVTVWSARNLRIRQQQSFLLSGQLASMAFALPAAIGVQLRFPQRQVFALAGDGGFAMLMGDFLTAVQYNLPIICVVFNNHKLGMIQLEQEVMGYPEYETYLHNPDFAAFAHACGGQGEKVTDPQLLEAAIEKAIASGKPYILDVEVNPDELVYPPHISLEQAMGFAKAKAIEFFRNPFNM